MQPQKGELDKKTAKDTAHISSELAKCHPHMGLGSWGMEFPNLPVSVPCVLGSPQTPTDPGSGLQWFLSWPKGAKASGYNFLFPSSAETIYFWVLGFQ